MKLDEIRERLKSQAPKPSGFRVQYERDEIEVRLARAIARVLDNDRRLLEHGPSERAVAHRLAVYLENEFPGWHTDCEYNRQGSETDHKQVNLPDGKKDADPDIVVHFRGPEGPNLELIRSRGQFPKGGYDVHDGEWQPASPATVQ